MITSRVDIVESSGLTPARPSASTQSVSTSTSSSLGSVIKGPVGARDSAVGGGGAELGQEIEVYNLLIVDQHSFAGISSLVLPFLKEQFLLDGLVFL